MLGSRSAIRFGLSASSLACAAAMSCLPRIAYAQDDSDPAVTEQAAEAADADENQIVVTARFREETLQDSPIAITALSGDALEARGIDTVEGIARSAPSVTLEQNTAGYGKSVLAYIRGVGQVDFLPSFEPGVGIYIDDVYQGTLFGSLFEFADVAQVEVLRGPQGTLFGKNNEGGAVRVTTRRAEGDGSGYVQFGLGSFDRLMGKGAFDMSIVPDTVFLRVAGGFNKIDGHVKRIDFACANPALAGGIPREVPANGDNSCVNGRLGGQESFSVRGNLRILASDNLEININADLLDDQGEPGAEELLAVNTQGTSPIALYQAGSPFGPNPTGYGVGVYYDQRFLTPDAYTTYASFNDTRFGLNFPAVNDVRSWGVSGNIDWDLSENLNLTSITAYRSYRGEFVENWGQAPIQINANYFKPYHWQLSQELRLNGKVGDLIEYTLGGYYYKALTELNDYIHIPVVGFAFFGRDPVRDEDKSAFAHLLITPTDQLSIEAGVRYSDITKEYTFYRNLPFTGNPPVSLPGFENNPVVVSKTDRFDYRVSAQYAFMPELMAYATYSTGFKGPGVNPRPVSIAELLPFAEEELESFEVGVKSELADRVFFNVAAYQSNYTNLQLTVTRVLSSGVPGSITANAGKARIRGVEAELNAEPIDDLLLNASVGYLDFEYLDLGAAANQPGGPCLDCTAPYVPDWSISAGAQYTFDLGKSGSIVPRVDWFYKSKTYNDVSNFEPAAIEGYDLWNARISYVTADDDWELALQVQNIADRRYFVNKFQGYFALGTIVGQPARPRTFLATLKYNFN
jgi:iron complex outermembrane receptor protein